MYVCCGASFAGETKTTHSFVWGFFLFIFKLFQFPFPTTNGHMFTYTIASMHVVKLRAMHLCIYLCNVIQIFRYSISFHSLQNGTDVDWNSYTK